MLDLTKHTTQNIQDTFGRVHNYLRISLTEKCNLRCTYCMPQNGIPLTPKAHLMTAEEILQIAKGFVDLGVTKIRLTGGEPLVRKDFGSILSSLSKLPITLSLTTNGILIDRYIHTLKENNITQITVSIDSLKAERFFAITRRNQLDLLLKNIALLENSGFEVKLNIVVIRGFNDDEIIDFVKLTQHKKISVRFIEYMPFDGNSWNLDQLVSEKEMLDQVTYHYPLQIKKLKDGPNDTAHHYQIDTFKGNFAFISSITNPFCDTCNRIRLTADGKIKNCLFSNEEFSILQPFREGKDISHIINEAFIAKKKMRAGMDSVEKIKNPDLHTQNRSMIAIGG